MGQNDPPNAPLARPRELEGSSPAPSPRVRREVGRTRIDQITRSIPITNEILKMYPGWTKPGGILQYKVCTRTLKMSQGQDGNNGYRQIVTSHCSAMGQSTVE